MSSAEKTLHDVSLASLIVDNALDYAIFAMDLDGRITAWSPGAERILGYTGDEAIGQDFAMIFLPADRSAGAHRAELDRAIQQSRAEDSRWHCRKDGGRFWANGVTMLLQAPSGPGVLKILRDETPMKLADDQRVLLLNELNHRIKNTLATVQSIAEQTLRAAEVDPTTRQVLTDRLIALSEAHNVLVKENWAGADLHSIVDQALTPYGHDSGRRFQVDGPPVRLSPQQAVAMALALHELATNALKYGALTRPEGTIDVTWNLAQDGLGGRHVTLLWQENGGPPVTPPTHMGFGTRLIARTFGRESGGRATVDYPAHGARCVIEVPLSSSEELPLLDVNGDGDPARPPKDPSAPSPRLAT
jgi:PAS domain S-box-containing protein